MDPALGTLTFRRLAHFVAVADAGSISAAAEGLHMSPSAVSGSVGELERALGAELLRRRRGSGVVLTPTGAKVLASARTLLGDAAELSYLAQGDGAQLRGPLAVGCFVTLAPTVLPRLLVEYETLHPLVTVDFLEGSQDTLQEKLLTGELDVAVLYDLDLTAPLDTIVLSEPRAYALFGEGHPLAGRSRVTMDELAREPLILYDTTPSTSYALSLFERVGLRPHVRHRTHGYELTRSIVARSTSAYAILIQRPSNKLSYEGLPIVECEIEPEPAACPVVLAWPRDTTPSPRARALAEVAGRQFAPR
jgi:DNA-binding transcriptional LysR family regulator